MTKHYASPVAIILIALLAFVISGCGSSDGGNGGSIEAQLTGISIKPDNSTIEVGSTQQFTAVASYSNETTEDITNKVLWSSNSPSSSIDADTGLAAGISIGTATITVTFNDNNTSTTLTVALNPVKALYPNYGANWNDYVVGGDISNATDTACDADADTACINGGLVRTFNLQGASSCTDITAEDSLEAFNWTCDNNTTPVSMVSTEFNNDMSIGNLIDFDSSVWLDMFVTVSESGVPVYTTTAEKWWSNPIVTDNDGGYLNTAGTIYTVTASNNNDYIINASSVGLIINSGAVIHGTGTAGTVVVADGSVSARDFIYLEGEIDATGDHTGVLLNTVSFSMLNKVTTKDANSGSYPQSGIHLIGATKNVLANVTATGNDSGINMEFSSSNTVINGTLTNNSYRAIALVNSTDNTLTNISANNNNGVNLRAVYIKYSSGNRLTNITASNNGSSGINITNSTDNILTNITTYNNNPYGIYLGLHSSNNTLVDITTYNNGYDGIDVSFFCNSNTLTNITTYNNGHEGVEVALSSRNNVLTNLTTYNNYNGLFIRLNSSNNITTNLTASNNTNGVSLNPSFNGTYSNINVTDNIEGGINVYVSEYNYFTGLLKAGNNAQEDCYVLEGTNPGLVNTTCSLSGMNDSNTYGVTNSSDATLSRGAAITTANSFVDVASGDFSLNIADTVLRDVLALPTSGDETVTHSWSGAASGQSDCDTIKSGSVFVTDHCESTLLRRAVEIHGDSIGNDNALCETGESCLYTPNIGSYQGHGNLISAGSIGTGGTLENINLWKYETNGYNVP